MFANELESSVTALLSMTSNETKMFLFLLSLGGNNTLLLQLSINLIML